MSFYENYVRLCNKIGKTPSGVAIEIGLAKPSVNRWKNGGGVTDATAQKVADYFGVPVQELIGEKKKETPTGTQADGLSEDAVKIGKAFDAAAPEMKKLVEAALSGAQSVRPDTVKIKITCPIDHTEQVIYQPVYRIGGKVIPESNNNGCEMCHQCEECKLCRLRATASILGDFDAK